MRQVKQFVWGALFFGAITFLSACGTKNNTETLPAEDTLAENNSPDEVAEQEKPSPLKKITGKVGDATVSLQYGSPGVKGRAIWGDLVPYNEIWRTGANEATWVEFDKDVKVNGQDLKAGKYALFTIPGEEEWTVIFNSVWEQWGAFDYDSSKDVLKVNVTPTKLSTPSERLEFSIDNNKISFMWETFGFSIDIM